jgi:hypothetical protein
MNFCISEYFVVAIFFIICSKFKSISASPLQNINCFTLKKESLSKLKTMKCLQNVQKDNISLMMHIAFLQSYYACCHPDRKIKIVMPHLFVFLQHNSFILIISDEKNSKQNNLSWFIEKTFLFYWIFNINSLKFDILCFQSSR